MEGEYKESLDFSQPANLFSLYAATSLLQGFYATVTGTPNIFLNGVYAGMLLSMSDEELDASVLDPSCLLTAEALTESSLEESMQEYSSELEKDFRAAYSSRKAWYDDLEKSIGTKTLSELIAGKYIDAPDAPETAIRAIFKKLGFFDKHSAADLNLVSATAAGGVSAFLKQASLAGETLGGGIGAALKYVGLTGTSKYSEYLASLIVINKTFQDIGKTSLKIPMDVFWSGIGGSLEGLEEFMRDVGVKDMTLEGMTVSDFQEHIGKALEKEKEMFSKIYATEKRKVSTFDKTFMEKTFSDIYVRNVKAGKKSDEIILRWAIMRAGSGADASLLELSDSARAAVRGSRRYVGQAVAAASSSATKGLLSGVYSAATAAVAGVSGLFSPAEKAEEEKESFRRKEQKRSNSKKRNKRKKGGKKKSRGRSR
ncbi:MAG: hypothetical protein RLN62_06420 [Rickettsiales bacterium]